MSFEHALNILGYSAYMTSSTLQCNVCASMGPHRLVTRKVDQSREGSVAALFKCGKCSSVFLESGTSGFDGDLYRYYENQSNRALFEIYPALTHDRYIVLLRDFEKKLEGRCFLDVGCGVGGFVRAAIASGWTGRGIDLAQSAITLGRKFDVPVSCTDFFSSEIAPASINLLTMFEFIEHVGNPGAFLRRAESVLKPGGLLYLTTPNFDSLDRYVLGNKWEAIHVEHLSYFSPSTLGNLVESRTDFEMVEVATKNVSVGLATSLLSAFRSGGGSKASTELSRNDARESFERHPLLRMAKKVVNAGLAITGLGSTLTMTLRKPR